MFILSCIDNNFFVINSNILSKIQNKHNNILANEKRVLMDAIFAHNRLKFA